jgi:multiple sugar transport system permease protein
MRSPAASPSTRQDHLLHHAIHPAGVEHMGDLIDKTSQILAGSSQRSNRPDNRFTQTLARLWRSDTVFALILIAPALIVISVVVIYPLLRSLVLSFQTYDLTSPATQGQWVGISQYLGLIKNKLFIQSWQHAFVFCIGTVLGQFVLGFSFALLLNRAGRFQNWFRGIYLLPWVLPPIAAALLWWWILDLSHGVINLTLKQLGLITEYIPWISNPNYAMYSVIVATIWRLFPFDMVMLLAGLQTVDRELLDAAAVDGANRLQQFLHVTLPHMRNIIIVVLLLTTIWSFQEFTMIWGITKGGPVYVTRTLNLFIYQTAFDFFRMGEAAAAGIMWLILLMVLSILVVRFTLREQEL